MPIVVNLDVILAQRKMRLTELAARVDLTLANLSILKTGKAKAIRFSTLEALCAALDCQPGDLLAWEPDAGAVPGDGRPSEGS
jgi:putative transcriptional regulator